MKTRDRAVILAYHSISEGTGYAWAVSPAAFEAQMAHLAASGRSVISLTELVRRLQKGESLEGAVAITFDDAYLDNLEVALPVLKKHGFPATIFVPTDLLGKPSKYGIDRFTSADATALSKEPGISLLPHSLTHPMLTRLSDAEAKREIEGSRDALADLAHDVQDCFSYPYGAYDERIAGFAREAGFHAAVAVRSKDVVPGTDLFALPRYAVKEDTTLAAFRAMLETGNPWKRAWLRAAGYRPGFSSAGTAFRRLWARADAGGWALLSRILFRFVPRPSAGPLVLDEATVDLLKRGKARARAKRRVPNAEREEMVSIGVFAYNRFDLLTRTADALSAYLREYGGTFRHEVILFHDGPNEEIRAWAEANPLFDRVVMNDRNRGLSYNINAFWYAESKGKFILNLEDDWVCEYKDNFVLNALDILQSDEAVGCVSLERRAPDDYRAWNRAVKIEHRVMSARVYETPERHHRYRLLPKSSYGNSCTLYRFDSLALTGRLPDGPTRRRRQEGEYIRRYSRLWMGARGIYQKDDPFLHIGGGRSCPTWDE